MPFFSKQLDVVLPGRLYRSGNPIVANQSQSNQFITQLKNNNIKRVISLNEDIDKNLPKLLSDNNIEHLHSPISFGSNWQSELMKWRKNASNILDKTPTLVHCKYGQDRTGFVVASYRVLKGMSPIQALSEAEKYDFGKFISPGVKKYMLELLGVKATDVLKTDDAVTIMRDDISQPMGGHSGMYAGVNSPAIKPQQSFAPYSDSTVETYPYNNKNARVLLLKRILKIAYVFVVCLDIENDNDEYYKDLILYLNSLDCQVSINGTTCDLYIGSKQNNSETINIDKASELTQDIKNEIFNKIKKLKNNINQSLNIGQMDNFSGQTMNTPSGAVGAPNAAAPIESYYMVQL
jgi:protein-tyrosine phosphatase